MKIINYFRHIWYKISVPGQIYSTKHKQKCQKNVKNRRFGARNSPKNGSKMAVIPIFFFENMTKPSEIDFIW